MQVLSVVDGSADLQCLLDLARIFGARWIASSNRDLSADGLWPRLQSRWKKSSIWEIRSDDLVVRA